MILTAHAHEGDDHGGEVSTSLFHYLEDPLFAIPLAILFIIALIYGLGKLGVSKSTIALVTLVAVFTLAILGLIYVPALGVLGIVIGFTASGVIVLSGIRNT